jgi:hypothetical protein
MTNILNRPFTLVAKSDGRPAVQVESGGKKETYVSS